MLKQNSLIRLLLLAVPILFFQCSSEQPDTAKTKPEAIQVNLPRNEKASKLPRFKTLKVSPDLLTPGIDLTGRVQPLEALTIVSEIAGKTRSSTHLFNEGETFSKGALMVNIDDEQARLDLQARRSQFKSALVRIMSTIKLDYPASFQAWDQYLLDFDSEKPLQDLPAVNDRQLDNLLSAKNIFSTFYQIKGGEEQLRKYQIYAPFNGVLTESNFSPGAVITPGVPLGKFSRTDLYEFKTSIAAADVNKVKLGTKLKVRSNASGQSWTGTIHRTGLSIDPATQNVPVFIRVSGKGLRSGLFLETTLEGTSLPGATRLPNHALTRTNEVHVIQDNVVKLKPIEVVSYQGKEVIVKGLSAGDQVIIEELDGPIAGKKAVSK
ncbi:MAG: HlyD family efflux transporter periplasmic adaptor subunit [Bacteroidota bacterium]